MNFKQEQSGEVTATFMPAEIATIVRLVKGSEEIRIAGLKDVTKESMKAVKEAEKELAPPLP